VIKDLPRRTIYAFTLIRCLLLCLVLGWQCGRVCALDPGRLISQYSHASWRIQDGVFSGSPKAIAQTRDGYLWIGTSTGLVRFDGVRFTPWVPADPKQLPSSAITSLLGAEDGSLWIGSEAGLARWKDGTWTAIPEIHARVDTIVQGRRGAIWVALTRLLEGSKPLCQVTDSMTRCYGADDGVSTLGGALLLDKDDNFWMGYNALLRWNPRSSHVYPVAGLRADRALDGVNGVAITRDGCIWAGIGAPGPGLGLQKFRDGKWTTFIAPDLDGSTLSVAALYADSSDNLWVGTTREGIYRIRGSKVDHFRSVDGLSSDYIYKFYEDREHNLWAATSKGLDSFHDTRVVSFSQREGISSDEVHSVLATRDGSIWIGSVEGLDVLRPGALAPVPIGRPATKGQVTSLLEDHAGRLWVGMDEKLLVNDGGGFRSIDRTGRGPLGVITGIAEDTNNNVWIETIGPPRALIRIRDFRIQEEFPVPQLPAARKVAAGSHGDIWLGLMDGDLARFRNGNLDVFSYEHTGYLRVHQVLPTRDGSVLGATEFGMIAWRDGRRQTLTVSNGLPCNGIYSMQFDRQDALWLYTQCGLIQIRREELDKWWKQSDARIQSRTLDVSDGTLPGFALFNTSAVSSDGRLWFANGVVLQMVDPAKLAGNDLPPSVHIETISADRKAYAVSKDVELPSLTRDLEIDYTALSFIIPSKVRFRYRLNGHDSTWQEPGTRRQAFYNDLGPGTYRFQVIACNNDGVWNEAGATLSFVIPPAAYQTIWFKVLVALSILSLIWLAHTARVRQTKTQVEGRLAERLEERGRIARELHDTLIQSVDGLMLRLQTALDEPDNQRSRNMIEKALDSADVVMLEGRQRVQSLRVESITVTELSEALEVYGKDLAVECRMTFSLAVLGSPQRLDPLIRDEIYRIGREALANACQHSGGTRIEIELTYDHAAIRLRVRDDGTGIDPQVLTNGRPGHWGLSVMRERAAKIGGHLDIWSRPETGTEIDFSISGELAYLKNLRPFPARWIERLVADLRGNDGR
jgi:signal transduction histidine kinase/ligand-binding sensor domain-containing protein